MCSPRVAHFDPTVEQNKTADTCLDYIKKKFTSDLENWTINEPNPMDAWNLHFISSKYPRGESLSVDEFLALLKSDATDYFWSCVGQGKLITTAWLKTSVPDYFATAKNIIVNVDKRSQKLLHRSNWYKHYDYSDKGVHLKIHDPAYTTPTHAQYLLKFNNPTYAQESFYHFIKNTIVNCKFKQTFAQRENFNHISNSYNVDLIDILCADTFVITINRITQALDLDTIDAEFLTLAHQHWTNCHSFKYSRVAPNQ